jgi:hypothetical protein
MNVTAVTSANMIHAADFRQWRRSCQRISQTPAEVSQSQIPGIPSSPRNQPPARAVAKASTIICGVIGLIIAVVALIEPQMWMHLFTA